MLPAAAYWYVFLSDFCDHDGRHSCTTLIGSEIR